MNSEAISKELNNLPPVHALIDSAIKNNKPANISLHEIAERCGFQRTGSKAASPTMSMLRSGSMRLPMDKIVIVADQLNIDRRKLFTAQLRDSVYNLIVKTDIPKVPKDRAQTPEEKLKHESSIITRASQNREFKKIWKELHELISNTHSPSESPLIEALREVEKEVGHEIKLNDHIIDDFKNMLRSQYSL